MKVFLEALKLIQNNLLGGSEKMYLYLPLINLRSCQIKSVFYSLSHYSYWH